MNDRVTDSKLGISIRLIRHWKPEEDPEVLRRHARDAYRMIQEAHWRATLTTDDQTFLRSLGIRP